MRRSLLILLLLSLATILGAQELVIKDQFHVEPNNLTATQKKYQKLDRNGNPCALILVGLVDKSATFHGDVVHAEYKQGEWWVYMIEGSQYLKIKTDDNLPKEITFPKLKKLTTYTVSFISNAPYKPNIPAPEPLLPFYEKVNDEWLLGYLDAKGNIAIPATLKGAGTYFDGGTARIEYNGNWTFIDIYGHEVESPSWSHSGLHVVKQNEKYGYADNTGRIVIPLQYEYAEEFKCNRAFVNFGDGKLGYITPKGKIIFRGRYNKISSSPDYYRPDFSSNYAVVKQTNGKYGFMDTNGIFQKQLGSYDKVRNFSEGLAAVSNKNGEWGFIDTSGRLAIPYSKCEDITSFSEGIAISKCRGMFASYWYFINKQGKTVAKINANKYKYVDHINDGLAVVIDNAWNRGYIDTHNGNIVIPLTYRSASRFEKGFAEVELYSPNYWVWINKSGKVLKDKYGSPYHSEPRDY